MVENLEELFEKYADEYLNFERIEKPRSGRADLHAFILLDELQPNVEHIISSAQHDEIFLGVAYAALVERITEEQVLELVRCGVMFNKEYYCLCMFV